MLYSKNVLCHLICNVDKYLNVLIHIYLYDNKYLIKNYSKMICLHNIGTYK